MASTNPIVLVTHLAPDPALKPAASRARALRNAKRWSRAGNERFVPHGIHGRHVTHPLIVRDKLDT